MHALMMNTGDNSRNLNDDDVEYDPEMMISIYMGVTLSQLPHNQISEYEDI
jgi:hypothetical protein